MRLRLKGLVYRIPYGMSSMVVAGRRPWKTSKHFSFHHIELSPWHRVKNSRTIGHAGRDASPSYQPSHRILQRSPLLRKIRTAKAVNILPLPIMRSVAISFCLPPKMLKPIEQCAIPCLQVMT